MKAIGNALSSLPIELLLEIVELLPLGARVNLALAEKALLRALFPSGVFPKLLLLDHIALLLHYESTSNDQYLCYGCRKLHSYNPAQGFDFPGHIQHIMDSARAETFDITLGNDTYTRLGTWPVESTRIHFHPGDIVRLPMTWPPWETRGINTWIPSPRVYTFEEVHLVMNRHFHGVGLPLDTLTQHFSYRRWANIFDGTKMETALNHTLHKYRPGEARCTRVGRRAFREATAACFSKLEGYALKDNEHQLQPVSWRSGQAESENVGSAAMLEFMLPWEFEHHTEAKIIDDELYLSFTHTVTGPLIPEGAFMRLLRSLDMVVCSHILCQNAAAWRTDWIFLKCNMTELKMTPMESVESCKWCFTDYKLSVKREEQRKRWEFSLVTYHRLGACRTPTDPAWYRLDCPWFWWEREHPYGSTNTETDMALTAGDIFRTWQNATAGGQTSTNIVPININPPQLNKFLAPYADRLPHGFLRPTLVDVSRSDDLLRFLDAAWLEGVQRFAKASREKAIKPTNHRRGPLRSNRIRLRQNSELRLIE